MEFVMLAIAILILLVLIVKFTLNTFVSLVVTAFILALLLGMNPTDVPSAVLGDQGMHYLGIKMPLSSSSVV